MKCAFCVMMIRAAKSLWSSLSSMSEKKKKTRTLPWNHVSNLFLALIKYFTGSHPSNLRIIGLSLCISIESMYTLHTYCGSLQFPSTIPLRQNHFILAPVEHHSVLQVLSHEMASLHISALSLSEALPPACIAAGTSMYRKSSAVERIPRILPSSSRAWWTKV